MLKRADLENGMYRNPVLYGDYSDPDVIRVGADYYMVSSSFCNAPALPLLHSKDLVNWKVINYICRKIPEDRYKDPVHGCGVWAPSIRYHKDEFYVVFPMPDEGIYVCRSKDPAGEWSAPVRILDGPGYIDPCPFWDDNGNAYLVLAVAFSRCGKKSILLITPADPETLFPLSEPVCVYDGNHTENETIEGPKLYKRNGFYYIFAPAGGVKVGHQVVLRSRSVFGPYEYRIVLKQGNTDVNGPHQGAWIDTPNGEDYFLHFQDVYAGGRIVHMQPMIWAEDWPVIGSPLPGQTYGEPVLFAKKPNRATDISNTQTDSSFLPDYDDSFSGPQLGLQWQWNANYEESWYSFGKTGGLHLNAVYKEEERPLCDVRNLLLQKWPAPQFQCTTVMDLSSLEVGETAGIVSLGANYAGLALFRAADDEYMLVSVCGVQDYSKEAIEKSNKPSYNCKTSVASEQTESVGIGKNLLKQAQYEIFFQTEVRIREHRDYLDRLDYLGQEQWARHIPQEEITLTAFVKDFPSPLASVRIPATAGRWVGVKCGVFCHSKNRKTEPGFAVVKNVVYSDLS